MNLIEQQSAAKDLPMQYLQQAVNGQNPNLTPWIATAELQRRTTMNQHMAPQGPQGPQPTVKDQVEQKAGLMATQAAQQAQAAQAQQGAAPPGPVPAGIPQPQPQSEPVMAARGGLMNAPVNFKFAHGGILGYADGGETANTNVPETYVDAQGVRRFSANDQPVRAAQAEAPARVSADMSPEGQAAATYSTSPTPPASMQEAITNEQMRAKAYGLDQPMGVEERDIIAQRNAAREQARKRQGLDAFAAYAAGAVGVPGSSGLAYSRARQEQDAAEREHLGTNLKDIRELNTAQRAAQEKRGTSAESGYAADKLAAAAAAQSKATTGANIYGTQEQAKASKYNVDEHVKSAREIEKLRERGATARQNSSDQKQALAELSQLERSYDADIKSLESQMRPLVGLFTPEAKAQVKELSDQLNLARDLKRRVRGGPAAAAPAATGAKITPAQAAALAKYGAK